jgi:hypothetical protein
MAKFAVMPHAQGLVAGQPVGRQASLGSTYSALVAPVFFRKVFCGSRYLRPRQYAVDEPCRICRSSALDQHRDLAMGKDLYRLAAEDNCGNAVAAMRSHDN